MLTAVRLQELHHRHVVRERSRGADDLVEIGRNLQHLFERIVEFASGVEIVE